MHKRKKLPEPIVKGERAVLRGTNRCAATVATCLDRNSRREEGLIPGGKPGNVRASSRRLPRMGWLMSAFIICCLCILVAVLPAAAADTLAWRDKAGRVDADIQAWDLPTLLQHLSAATGWQILFDPGATLKVSVKFKNLSTGDALRSLLGDLNFAVVPQTNGPSQLYVFRTSRGQATQIVRAPAKKVDTSKPIPNELVVILKPGSKASIDELARRFGAKVILRMDAQNAYLLQFDSDAAAQAARAQLADNPDVQAVDSNFPTNPVPTMSMAVNSTAPNLQLQPKPPSGGCQLVVGLIDTAVQPLAGNLDTFLQPRLQVAGNYQPPADQILHGTAMAETILQAVQAKSGGSTSVRIQPVDVYGASETTTTFDVANGIVQAVNNGADVINLSLGSSGDSSFLHGIITQVSQRGIPIYAAAGNQPVTTPTYPAAYPEVVAVTASGANGQIAPYANRGSFVDMIAPGDNVVPFDGQSYLVEGTSTATAIASGLAAGLADQKHACADQAQALLQATMKLLRRKRGAVRQRSASRRLAERNLCNRPLQRYADGFHRQTINLMPTWKINTGLASRLTNQGKVQPTSTEHPTACPPQSAVSVNQPLSVTIFNGPLTGL